MLIEVYREDNEIWVTVRDDIIKGEVFKEAREIDDIFKLIVGDQHAAAGFRDNLFYRLKKTAINKGLKGLFDTVVQAQEDAVAPSYNGSIG
ncbi:hypothetical protein COLO4_09769 [Corchorus olitorius]|uniref:Uncharacterized protein n=1 Tax=Corchorus olitorius TaxID=93759 RepID=A0A1R3KB47_9ROSI|nr:hypothetical protein COLO4_09769 [Corchorus olitorius]